VSENFLLRQNGAGAGWGGEVLYRQRNNNNNNNNPVKNKSFSRTMITVFFSACSFFLSVQNLKNKPNTLAHTCAHTHTQLPLSESVLNMFVSLSSPPPHVCKYSLAAAVLPLPAPPRASSLARACGFSGGNKRVEGRKPKLLHLALHLPKPLVIFPPRWVSFPHSPLSVVRLLVFCPHLSSP